jgi:hypothetical protein
MLERIEIPFWHEAHIPDRRQRYGSADNLAWLVKQTKITPHIPVFDRSNRTYVAIGKAARCAIASTEVCDAARARDIRKAAQAAP